MRKPLILRFVSWLARRLGRERFIALQCRVYGRSLAGGAQGREVRRVLERVHAHGGRRVSEEDLKRQIEEMVWIYSDIQATVHLMSPQTVPHLAERVELALLPRLAELRAAGRGVILACPHFGNVALAMVGLVMAGVPLNMIVINAQPYRWLDFHGLRLVDLGSSALDCVRALARNEAVLLMSDLDFFPDNRTADFFGAPIHPPHGPARLALACSAPVLPIYPIHLGGGRYRVVCDSPIVPGPRTGQEEIETRLLRSMEDFIARSPAQWVIFRDIWDVEYVDILHRRRLVLLARWKRLAGWLERY